MPSKRNINLIKYGISGHRYGELKSFCLQYNEWRDKLKYQKDALKSVQITDMPFSGGIGDSTYDLAARRMEWSNNCAVVEQTMIQAITTLKKGNTSKYLYDGDFQDIYQHMIKSVTEEDINYTYLWKVMRIPIGEKSYYQFRRYFFFLLDKNKK